MFETTVVLGDGEVGDTLGNDPDYAQEAIFVGQQSYGLDPSFVLTRMTHSASPSAS